MSTSMDLHELAGRQQAAAPYGFEEFQRRRQAAERRRSAAVWSIAAAVGVLGLVALLALLTQGPQGTAVLARTAPVKTTTAHEDVASQPALVDMGQFAVTSELEDHIALLDEQISAARVYAAPPEQLRELEYTRKQLNDSLQRISYAQNLLNL